MNKMTAPDFIMIESFMSCTTAVIAKACLITTRRKIINIASTIRKAILKIKGKLNMLIKLFMLYLSNPQLNELRFRVVVLNQSQSYQLFLQFEQEHLRSQKKFL